MFSRDERPAGDFVWNADDPSLREPFAATSLDMHFSSPARPSGRPYRERTIGGKTYRYYADEGRRMGSVWSRHPRDGRQHAPRTAREPATPPRSPRSSWSASFAWPSLPGRNGRRFDVRQRHHAGRRREARSPFHRWRIEPPRHRHRVTASQRRVTPLPTGSASRGPAWMNDGPQNSGTSDGTR